MQQVDIGNIMEIKHMLMEILKHPRYCISDDGVVYRKERSGLFKLSPDLSNGYARVDLDGKKENIGRLVLEAFDPTLDSSLKVFYIDGDQTNNRLDNLVWLNSSEVQLYSRYTIEYRKQMLSRGAR